MSMWNGKTDLWGRKTRPINLIKHKSNGESKVEKEIEYIEIEDKIKAMEAEIIFLKNQLLDKCKEIANLQIQSDSHIKFTQNVVMELIHVKNTVPAPAALALSPLAAYKAKKESEMSVKDINKSAIEGKLP